MSDYTNQIMQQVSHWFELADRRFDSYDHPLWQRPLSAALYTASHGLKRNYDKSIKRYEDLLIGHLLNAAKIWYKNRYGEENLQPPDGSITGVVLFKKIPIELSIPLISSRLTDDDQYRWVTFLTGMADDENPASFLQRGVPFESLNPKARKLFDAKITFVVSATRKICTSARIVHIEDAERRDMCHSVVERINMGASLINQNTSLTRAMSIWEFFFAIEILLKTYIYQKGEQPENIHSLGDLTKKARSLGLKAALNKISDLPSTRNAIQHRYAQRGATTDEALKVYEAALSVGTELIAEIELAIIGENFGLKLINKPGWLFPPV